MLSVPDWLHVPSDAPRRRRDGTAVFVFTVKRSSGGSAAVLWSASVGQGCRCWRGSAVGGVEQDLLERAGQVAVPDQGRRGGQRMAGDADPDHVTGARWLGQPDHAERDVGDGNRAGQDRGRPFGGGGEGE